MEGLKQKQQKAFAAFKSAKYRYHCHAGSTGSGKSFLDIGILHLLCCKIPGSRFFIGRKSEKNLKLTTIPSYNEIKRKSKSSGASKVVDMSARYTNGSEIAFIWCDRTKDPDLNNIRGFECNGGLFEEANQIDRGYFELAKTRIAGRWRPDLRIPPFIILNLNPSRGWVKDLFYDNWIAGTLPDGHYFEEFDENDTRAACGEEGLKPLLDLAPEEYSRFVKNRWDYSEAANQLISYEWYKNCMRTIDPEIIITDKHLGVTDPAWEGDDLTVFAQMHGNHIGWWEEYEKQDPDFSGIIAVERAKINHVRRGDWVVDPVGIGSATVLKMRNDLKFEPDMFYGGSPATNMFGVLEAFNKRSEAHWLLAECMRKGEITFTHDLKFKEQCLALKYYLDDKKIRIIGKKEIKSDIGESPGMTDCASMLVHKWKTEGGSVASEIMDRQQQKVIVESSRAARDRSAIISRIRNSE